MERFKLGKVYSIPHPAQHRNEVTGAGSGPPKERPSRLERFLFRLLDRLFWLFGFFYQPLNQ